MLCVLIHLKQWVSDTVGGGGGDRTRVRQSAALGSTCLVVSIDLARYGPSDRA